MTKLVAVDLNNLEHPTPLPARRLSLDGTLLAVGVGLALWFVCAVLVLSTFVHPVAPRVPAVNPHGGHSFLLAAGR